MNILVLHSQFQDNDRKTIQDSLSCFQRYVKKHHYFYLNLRTPDDIPPQLHTIPFDGVIFHYTFLSFRNAPKEWAALYKIIRPFLQQLKGYKVAIPQDEYSNTGSLRQLFKECNIDHIFTCASEEDYDTLYPQDEIGRATYSTVYTGYVNEDDLDLILSMSGENTKRTIDIGYRARQLPFWLGRHGQLKTELAEYFTCALNNYPKLVTDISTTGETGQRVFYGNEWLDFLLRCRTMLGCLGGSGLMDVEGTIVSQVDSYCEAHPHADFEEVEEACFPGQDGNIQLYALSPRHFECAMTKTCQILIEGDYGGIFLPNVHYIEVKRDYSNLDEVLTKIHDEAYCIKIAQQCFDDIVLPHGKKNPHTYAWFANHVVKKIAVNSSQKKSFTILFSWCITLYALFIFFSYKKIQRPRRHFFKKACYAVSRFFTDKKNAMSLQIARLKTGIALTITRCSANIVHYYIIFRYWCINMFCRLVKQNSLLFRFLKCIHRLCFNKTQK